MSIFLPRLESGWHVDQAILAEESRVVVIRFGHDYEPDCMRHDETLYGIAEKVKNMAVICKYPSSPVTWPLTDRWPRTDTVDITAVPDFNKVCLSPIPTCTGTRHALTARGDYQLQCDPL